MLTADVDSNPRAHNLCEEVIRPGYRDCLLSSEVAQGVLLIPVSGRVVGVVGGRDEQNDEQMSETPRSVL